MADQVSLSRYQHLCVQSTAVKARCEMISAQYATLSTTMDQLEVVREKVQALMVQMLQLVQCKQLCTQYMMETTNIVASI
jgi:hypothetical protein